MNESLDAGCWCFWIETLLSGNTASHSILPLHKQWRHSWAGAYKTSLVQNIPSAHLSLTNNEEKSPYCWMKPPGLASDTRHVLISVKASIGGVGLDRWGLFQSSYWRRLMVYWCLLSAAECIWSGWWQSLRGLLLSASAVLFRWLAAVACLGAQLGAGWSNWGCGNFPPYISVWISGLQVPEEPDYQACRVGPVRL